MSEPAAEHDFLAESDAPWDRWSLLIAMTGAGLIVMFAAGCGPVRSTQAISKAEVEFERARVAGAHKKAPYEYYSAKQYLHKAKEEWGYSEFEPALDFADQAERAAESARRKAKEDPWEDPVDREEGGEGQKSTDDEDPDSNGDAAGDAQSDESSSAGTDATEPVSSRRDHPHDPSSGG